MCEQLHEICECLARVLTKASIHRRIKELVNDMESSNEARATAVEQYILQQGVAAGVVK